MEGTKHGSRSREADRWEKQMWLRGKDRMKAENRGKRRGSNVSPGGIF